jgi:hypothetical protein
MIVVFFTQAKNAKRMEMTRRVVLIKQLMFNHQRTCLVTFLVDASIPLQFNEKMFEGTLWAGGRVKLPIHKNLRNSAKGVPIPKGALAWHKKQMPKNAKGMPMAQIRSARGMPTAQITILNDQNFS